MSVLDPWSGAPISSWSELLAAIDVILTRHHEAPLVWRGVTDARWGLYSSLYRRLKKTAATVTEEQMRAAEADTLTRARREWRFDHLSGLELLAHIQHYGGATRLLDVTENPLIATWFAVEEQRGEDGVPRPPVDARVYCFYVGEYLELDAVWGGRDLPWHEWTTSPSQIENEWGTGRARRVWRPPAYNERISAQNGGFILDGVPRGFPGWNDFRKFPGDQHGRWTIDEIRDASSIPLKLHNPQRARQTTNARPAFTFRIAAEAVSSVRERLERNFGYSTGSIYSDLYGLAQHSNPALPR